MRDVLLYDYERYALYRRDNHCATPYAHITDGDIVELRDRTNGTRYRDVYKGKNRSYNLVFLELAGGIYVEPAFCAYIPSLETELYNAVFEDNIVRVTYDGATHITIEDRDYIYRYDMPYRGTVDVKYQDRIFLIIIDYCEKRRIIVVSKPMDYVEMLNAAGDETEITDKCIYVTTHFRDSMGRIRREEYSIVDDVYRCTKVDFEYTYIKHYDIRHAKFYIEDAIYSRDYHFIAEHMASTTSDEGIGEYIDSILPQHIDILREEIGDDIMRFIVRDKGRTYLKNIKIYLDKDGYITNLEETTDEG